MSQKTKVQFYWDTPDEGITDVFAVFPEIIEKPGYYACYSHVGQHSTASFEYVAEAEPATPEQYADLKKELEREFGYDLEILPG